jgi:hypothetical protein
MPEYFRRRDNHTNSATRKEIILLVLGSVAAFLVVCLLINLSITRYFWQPDLGSYSDRIAALNLNKDKVDTIFIGSSHVQYGVNPILFDEVAQREGLSTSSFKISLQALSVPWIFQSLEELNGIDFPNLKYVIVEPRLATIQGTKFRKTWNNALSLRTRFISGVDNSQAGAALLWSSQVPTKRKLLDGVNLLHNLWLNLANLGVLQNVLIQQPGDVEIVKLEWESRGGVPSAAGSVRPNLNLAPPDWTAGHRQLSGPEKEVLAGIITRVEKLGAKPVFIFVPGRVAPGLRVALLEEAQRGHADVRVIGETESALDTDYYERRELWWDDNHMNQEGADIFSAEIARQMADIENRLPPAK